MSNVYILIICTLALYVGISYASAVLLPSVLKAVDTLRAGAISLMFSHIICVPAALSMQLYNYLNSCVSLASVGDCFIGNPAGDRF